MIRETIKAGEAFKRLNVMALKHPETAEGVACAGTVIEKRTIPFRNKAFLFLGMKDLMLKLEASLPEAARLAEAEPDNYKAGKTGWVTARLSDGDCPPLSMLEKWIAESYQLVARGKPAAKAVKRAGARAGR